MTRYSFKPRTKIYVKEYGFWSFARNIPNRYIKQLLDNATKRERDAVKAASKKVVHKAAKAADEFIGNKIADKIMKLKPVIDENSRNAKEIVISPVKRQEI